MLSSFGEQECRQDADYENDCVFHGENTNTWCSYDLAEDTVSLLESCKKFLQNEN